MIDAHVHVWRIGSNGCTWPPPSLPAIHRDFLLDDWRAAADPGPVKGAILVQSQEDPADTAWLLDVADGDPAMLGVVGWTDVAAADAAQAITRLARHPRLCGLRPMVQDRPEDWWDQPAFDPSWAAMAQAGLVLDALIRPVHLPGLARLAARHPALSIVVDHAAKPVFADLSRWRQDLAILSAHSRVRCKLSGLWTELPPGEAVEAIEPAVAILVELFGPDRLIWGSDWPVLTLAGSYGDWLDQARRLVPQPFHHAVFGGTARATYGLSQ